MDDLARIVAIAAQNTDAVGFIPSTTIETQYLSRGLYVLRPRGYILHGPARGWRWLNISQAAVDADYRLNGLGAEMVREVVARAQNVGALGVRLRCASDLDANEFWKAMGFEHIRTLSPRNRRRREINVYELVLQKRLWEMALAQEAV